MINLVCFDLDGVLVDACDLHKTALEAAMLNVLGFKISDEDHYSKFNGLPTKTKLKMLNVSDAQALEVNNLKQELTVKLIDDFIKFDANKLALISYLKSNSVKVAVVTNSIRKTTIKMLDKCGILDYIDLIVTNEDISRPKPDPEGYNFAIKTLGSSPEITSIVEDSKHGLEAARKSNARVIQVESPLEVNLDLARKLL